LEKRIVAINDSGDDLFVLIFSDDPPRVRDFVTPFTLLSWTQMGGALSVRSQIIDSCGKQQERCMTVRIEPNNFHALRALKGWLPTGKRPHPIITEPPNSSAA